MAWKILLLSCMALVIPAILVPINPQISTLPEYTCVVDYIFPLCGFGNLRLTHENYNFIPKSDKNISEFSAVGIDESTIPVFSSDICETFPHITLIMILSCDLEMFVSGALDSCTNLKVLYMIGNKVKRIQPDIFQYNPRMELVEWISNGMEEIDGAMFKGLNLWAVDLGGNQLQEFSFDWLEDSDRLEHVWVHSNNLTELDLDERHINRFTNLTSVAYNGNRIACSRVEAMNELLDQNDIYIDERKEYSLTHHEPAMMQHQIEIGQVGGIECVLDGSKRYCGRNCAKHNDEEIPAPLNHLTRYLTLLYKDLPCLS